jgi:hypothetical protein
MLEQSSIPLFLYKRLCLNVVLYLCFSFSLEKHTLLNVGLKKCLRHFIIYVLLAKEFPIK